MSQDVMTRLRTNRRLAVGVAIAIAVVAFGAFFFIGRATAGSSEKTVRVKSKSSGGASVEVVRTRSPRIATLSTAAGVPALVRAAPVSTPSAPSSSGGSSSSSSSPPPSSGIGGNG